MDILEQLSNKAAFIIDSRTKFDTNMSANMTATLTVSFITLLEANRKDTADNLLTMAAMCILIQEIAMQ